ncbi:hypothetical protein LAZ67_14000125 [Cordylochernes scorpioides]|uniref:Uncharacterized protein n=1 Tax=Cordylochernes scorpioides TaxID=51811 RepID=A0ABY6LA69_9ARAC|nr:hypothetical protein LAZ67_14000125 [Cordylochernes scorpioides]
MEAPLKDCTTLEQRAVIRFLNAEGIQTSQICQRMKYIYEHPAYSPDLAPSDYFLFGLLKKELKRKRFDSDEDVQKMVQDFFHTLPKSAYKEGIYEWPERWRRCIESKVRGCIPNVDCEATLDRNNVYRGYKMFSEGREDVNDEERAGRPSTSTTDEKINEVEKIILANRRITVSEVAEDLNISIGSCHSIFIND